ncbi:MAG TPA: energy-coupled thiamine transporter ThiT [Clostridia bacterium]|nr:energy-coupled thiamine transporter ThiT [Clostridia bacterium]
MKNFNELSIFDKSATLALYLTIAVLVLIGIIYFSIKKVKPDMLKPTKNLSAGFLIGYAIGLLGILFYLKLDEYISADYIDPATFYPIIAMLATAIILTVVAFFISIFKKSAFKLYSKIAFGSIFTFALVLFILNMVKTYKLGQMDAKSESLLYIFTISIIGIVIALAFVFGKKTTNAEHTKSIVYAALCIATSFALSYIRFFELPLGGSITFASLVPLMIYAYMFGMRKGVLAGAIYGLLQFIQAPWFIHPVQFLLDYPIAFAAIGLTGLFKEIGLFKSKAVLQFAFGAIIAVILRYFSHVVSGIFIWGSGNPENYSAVAWSFLYNSFAFADLAVALIAGCLLFSSRAFVRQLDVATSKSITVSNGNIEEKNE